MGTGHTTPTPRMEHAMQIRALVLWSTISILLCTCGQPTPIAPQETPLLPRLVGTPQPPSPSPTAPPTSTVPLASATPAPTATPADALTQYRYWMDEARALHPYPEDIEQMWAVMICESKGDPSGWRLEPLSGPADP
jgi:hypothetical protein